MEGLTRQVKRLADILNLLAGWCLLTMTGLTFLDVILRLFRRPILGTYEMMEFLGAAVAAFAIAHTTLNRAHVAVDVVVLVFSKRLQRVMFIITHGLAVFLFALLSVECIRYGNDFRVSGEVSMTLRLPFYPILYGISFATLVTCLVLLTDLFFVISGREAPNFRWKE